MTFTLVGQPDAANPVLTLRAGERVRLTLKNEAPGLLHDITIPDLRVTIEQLRQGETGEAVFTVPTSPGKHEYLCRPHSELMRGVVDITP